MAKKITGIFFTHHGAPDWLNEYIDYYGYKDGHFIRKGTINTPTLTPTPTKKPTVTPAKDDDPYDAKDYADPDDFYYDYYDEFIDFEEAEEYWEENQ